MLFPTFEFGIFFILVFSISWILRNRQQGRKIFLVAASYFFYGYWDWRFMLLLFLCSMGNYFFGKYIAKADGDDKKRKKILIGSIIFNLGILGFFKYYDFFISSVNTILFSFGATSPLPILNIILPVGISFFTFQAMSYVIDVYRKEITHVSSALDILLYVSFFPQLVAGPIVRAKDFLPQLEKKPDPDKIPADKAALLIAGGLFKKAIIANYLATLLVDRVFENPGAYSGIELLFAVYAYAVQIYCDFSAYSDIAIGIAHLMGYEFPRNFNHPYRSKSLKEFWRRWHISLSTWLRDYLYIPLGGSKFGKFNTYKNLLLTMLLGGLWHGAAWNFVIWGAIHGVGLAIERFFNTPVAKKQHQPEQSSPGEQPSPPHEHITPPPTPIWLKGISVFLTFHIVCLSWIFFRAGDFSVTIDYFSAFFSANPEVTLLTPFVVFLIFFGLSLHFIPESFREKIHYNYSLMPLGVKGIVLGIFFVSLSIMAPEGVAPFIYFQF